MMVERKNPQCEFWPFNMCLSMEVQPHLTCVFLQPVLRGSGPLELSFSSKQVRAAPLVFIATRKRNLLVSGIIIGDEILPTYVMLCRDYTKRIIRIHIHQPVNQDDSWKVNGFYVAIAQLFASHENAHKPARLT